MNQVTFDWAMGKITVLHNEDPVEKVQYYASIEVLFNTLTEPTRIISEATFESYDLEQRKKVIKMAEDAGHVWLTTPNRQTGRHRYSMGWTDEKTDEIDVQVIRDMAKTRPEVLKVPRVREENDPLITGLNDVRAEMMILRRSKTMRPSTRAKLGFVPVSAKDEYAKTLIPFLPEYSTLPEDIRLSLGNGKEYSKTLIAAAGKAAKHADNRREFEHYAGLFGHGYPSQLRSDFMHWGYRLAHRDRGVTLSQFRKSCRWLYHQLRKTPSVL
jgi:hypothetical protein